MVSNTDVGAKANTRFGTRGHIRVRQRTDSSRGELSKVVPYARDRRTPKHSTAVVSAVLSGLFLAHIPARRTAHATAMERGNLAARLRGQATGIACAR